MQLPRGSPELPRPHLRRVASPGKEKTHFFRSAFQRTHPSTMAASRSLPCPWSTSSTKLVYVDRLMRARRLMKLYEPDPSDDIPVCSTASRLNICILPHNSQPEGSDLEAWKIFELLTHQLLPQEQVYNPPAPPTRTSKFWALSNSCILDFDMPFMMIIVTWQVVLIVDPTVIWVLYIQAGSSGGEGWGSKRQRRRGTGLYRALGRFAAGQTRVALRAEAARERSGGWGLAQIPRRRPWT